MKKLSCSSLVILFFLSISSLAAEEMALEDPGFEQAFDNAPNKFGQVFKYWPGWIYSQPAEMRVGRIPHSGKSSGMIICENGGCARFYNEKKEIEPGRYRLTFYLRALDIVPSAERENLSICFYDNKWHEQFPDLKGSCGWRKITHVVDVSQKQESRIYVGLKRCSGRIWVDDVRSEKVGPETPLTAKPVLGPEETRMEMPSGFDQAKSVRCPDCGYRNMPEWKECYACGAQLATETKPLPQKLLGSFENGKIAPFAGKAEISGEHATAGSKAIKWEGGYIIWDGPQDWTGYDFLKADLYLDGDKPVDLNIEIRDKETRDYWSRVNCTSMLLPGKNTLVLPTNLFVGEKSRPGRPLLRDSITRLVFNTGDSKTPLYLDNLRLECDDFCNAGFDGLLAYSFGPQNAPLLRGLTRVSPGTTYSKGRGFGFLNAKIWRAYDVLQPDIVYRSFVCVESGGFAVDLPNGKYHVFVNNDCPGGFWGELPKYRERKIVCEGKPVYAEAMDKEKAITKYFRFADKDDLYTENTFDKYLGEIFREKEFDADVADGQLNIDFTGKDWSNCVSCIVIFPYDRLDRGRQYLAKLKERRRFDFDNYFHRLLHSDKNPEPELTDEQRANGYCMFSRNYMEDIYPDSKPAKVEFVKTLSGFAAAGEIEPVTFALRAYKDLGEVKVVPSELKGPKNIPASNIKVGYVSNRVSRINADGSAYTIRPRYIMNSPAVELHKGMTRWFWADVRIPDDAVPGVYRGQFALEFANGKKDSLDVAFEVVGPRLAELDVPAGPWGLEIRVPWFDDEMKDYNNAMDARCLDLMREYGCTTFSSSLNIGISGKGRELKLDFAEADRIMGLAKAKGMRMFMNYGTAIKGVNLYGYPVPADPAAFGFQDLESLYKHIFTMMDRHAAEAGWIPLVITVSDEPMGENVGKCAKNAALLKNCATDRIRFAGATSMSDKHRENLPLVQGLDITNFNIHDRFSIDEANKGGGWAFYNSGNRWTYGPYMYMLKNKEKMKFRIAWHWNSNAGDPYYALDCREDDYAWANANARGGLVTSIGFERIREGIDDYRYLLTLKNLVEKSPGSPVAAEAKALLAEVMALEPAKDRGVSNDFWNTEPFTGKSCEIRRKAAELIRKFSE